jgi:phosphatidylserine/phosphatidylglycerophosphate/cardiolipin synthase-like enzyme
MNISRRRFVSTSAAAVSGFAFKPTGFLDRILRRAPLVDPPNEKEWFLCFDDKYKDSKGKPCEFIDGRPFGMGTEMRSRIGPPRTNPWDEGCAVEMLYGGYATMTAIGECFESMIANAANLPADQKGHVYIAGWRLNANRDMSENADPWNASNDQFADRTAFGFIRRLMKAGVKVRILVWLPSYPYPVDPNGEHINAHFFLAKQIQMVNDDIRNGNNALKEDLGVVLLDRRWAERNPIVSSHHQKFIVVRSPDINVAFCGGVDLAYTRRDHPQFNGDWQSGSKIPMQREKLPNVAGWASDQKSSSDLITSVYGDDRQRWFDLHLKLQGSIVRTLEQVFVERWSAPCFCGLYYVLSPTGMYQAKNIPLCHSVVYETPAFGDVISTSAELFLKESVTREFAPCPREIVLDQDYVVEESVLVKQNGNAILVGSTTGLIRATSLPFTLHLQKTYDRLSVSYDRIRMIPLPAPGPLPGNNSPGEALVQVWQTIPIRQDTFSARNKVTFDAQGKRPLSPAPHEQGEFTVMAGVAKAAEHARQMIFVLDQYFWSIPYAKLLLNQLRANLKLHVIIVLPPHSDLDADKKQTMYFAINQHQLRMSAIKVLKEAEEESVRDRVMVASLWYRPLQGKLGYGIYCHAKVQLFDDCLLICGSSNVNRRSHTNDTELTCAVLSREQTQEAYSKVWEYLFQRPFPAALKFEGNWGELLFHSFKQAVPKDTTTPLDPEPNVILDPWGDNEVKLPNDYHRFNAIPLNKLPRGMIGINNPSGFDLSVGEPDPDDTDRVVSLRGIVDRLEGPQSKEFRKP